MLFTCYDQFKGRDGTVMVVRSDNWHEPFILIIDTYCTLPEKINGENNNNKNITTALQQKKDGY